MLKPKQEPLTQYETKRECTGTRAPWLHLGPQIPEPQTVLRWETIRVGSSTTIGFRRDWQWLIHNSKAQFRKILHEASETGFFFFFMGGGAGVGLGFEV